MNSAMPHTAAREQLLERWIQQYGDSVLRICFVYLADASQAEDAAQDTFIKAWLSMKQFEGRSGSSEKTWLMRIAINTCRDYHRSKWFRYVDSAKALEKLPPSMTAVLPEDRLLMPDILRLPEKYKQVILLYHYQHMTLAEVAEALGASPSTVQHRLKKAEASLKQTLTGGS